GWARVLGDPGRFLPGARSGADPCGRDPRPRGGLGGGKGDTGAHGSLLVLGVPVGGVSDTMARPLPCTASRRETGGSSAKRGEAPGFGRPSPLPPRGLPLRGGTGQMPSRPRRLAG